MNSTCIGSSQAREAIQKCCLAHAVSAEQSPKLPAFQLQVQVTGDLDVRDADIESIDVQSAYDFSLARFNSSRNNGTPRIAVMTPTGSCRGAMTDLARVSETTRKHPPNSVAAGIRIR